jgi:hypothetical protein
MGWDEYFVRKGFDTYLADQVSRARSGFDATNYNEVRNGALPITDQAAILIGTDQLAWTAFRWGTTPCTVSPCSSTTTPHPGIEFPMNTVGVGAGSNLQFFLTMMNQINGAGGDMKYALLPALTPGSIYLDPLDPCPVSST